MKLQKNKGMIFAGMGAGLISGLFGAGGGMILIPLMTLLTDIQEEEQFPTSVSIILPICLVSLFLSPSSAAPEFSVVLPYLIGSAAGGIAAGMLGKKIPIVWMHRILGAMILWGGIRYLC